MSKLTVEEFENYRNLGRALKISNQVFDVIVTLDVGPRVMHFSKSGGGNILEDEVEISEPLPDGNIWKLYGGHRVWHSPEAFPRSYMSDSLPLEKYELLENRILMLKKEEPWVQVQKAIKVELLSDRVKVVNCLTNKGAWPIEIAVWALTVGSRGGREVCPVVQKNTGLLPNTFYVLWPYSRLNDKRVYWGEKYIIVDNNPQDYTAFKFGYPNEYGWVAFFNRNLCFIKKYTHYPNAKYPDFGCSWETYTSFWGTELESLSPLKVVDPGETVEHVEEWFLFEDVEFPTRDEEVIEKILTPLAIEAGIELPKVVNKGWNPQAEK